MNLHYQNFRKRCLKKTKHWRTQKELDDLKKASKDFARFFAYREDECILFRVVSLRFRCVFGYWFIVRRSRGSFARFQFDVESLQYMQWER